MHSCGCWSREGPEWVNRPDTLHLLLNDALFFSWRLKKKKKKNSRAETLEIIICVSRTVRMQTTSNLQDRLPGRRDGSVTSSSAMSCTCQAVSHSVSQAAAVGVKLEVVVEKRR